MNKSLPPAFIEHLRHQPGADIDSLTEAIADIPPVSIRLNPNKPSSSYIENREQIPWASQGFYLPERPSFTLDPVYHAGAYYVQEAGSMFVGTIIQELLKTNKIKNALDLCAAPGGKTTDLASVLDKDTFILANETNKTRVSILYENIVKWGNDNIYISQNDPKSFSNIKGFFDLVVADVPCSGSGMFRKDPQSIEHWSVDSVVHCSLRQQRIVEDVWPSIKAGGFMIYSTCSYSVEENEEIVEYICNTLGAEVVNIPLPYSHIYQTKYGYRFYPNKLDSEGFFISVLQKTEELVGDSKVPYYNTKLGLPMITKHDRAVLDKYIVLDKENLFDMKRDIYYKKHPAELQFVGNYLNIYKRGVKLGKVIRNELIADHELCMMHSHNIQFNKIDIDKETALNFLRKSPVMLDDAMGWAMLCYENLPLGLIKNLENRSNNYYPTEWRIRNL
ncbi:MAG: RNA methyltransferase [Bacteroidota bacterium]|nr:RNA methyltransferase [Bacteroidota bacterium]